MSTSATKMSEVNVHIRNTKNKKNYEMDVDIRNSNVWSMSTSVIPKNTKK